MIAASNSTIGTTAQLSFWEQGAMDLVCQNPAQFPRDAASS